MKEKERKKSPNAVPNVGKNLGQVALDRNRDVVCQSLTAGVRAVLERLTGGIKGCGNCTKLERIQTAHNNNDK